MKKPITAAWTLIMDHRLNPLKYTDLASSHYLMQVLAWMWSMIFSLSFLSIFAFGIVWLAHILLIAGAFMTLSIFSSSEARHVQTAPALCLSRASKCIWKLDSEA